MTKRMTYSRAIWLVGAASSALLAATPVWAQTEGTSTDSRVTETVVVTGSLLKSDPANASSPVQTVTAVELETRGITNAADALAEVPALLGSNTVDQSLRDSAVVGRVTLDLRGLGTNRTLVLVNGRRHVSGQPGSAAVDIASIPSAMIERVDVLTGGASALYGSDAVTGVVNFILKQDFEGLQFDQQVGLSQEGDAGEVYASILAGRNFGADDRANLTANLSYNKRSGILEGDRDWSAANGVADDYPNPELQFQAGDPLPPGVTPAQAERLTILLANGQPRFANTPQALIDRARNAKPRAIRRDPRFSISSTSGIIGIDLFGDGFASFPGDFSTTLDANGNGINDCRESTNGRRGFGCFIYEPGTGVLRPFRDGIFAGANNQFGGDGSEQRFSGQSLTPSTESIAFNLNGKYEISKEAVPYFEAKVVQNKAFNFAPYNTFDDFIRITNENPFIPAPLRALMNAEIAADPSIADTIGLTIMRDHTDVFDPRQENTRKTYRAVLGMRGDLPYNMDYDVSLNFGRTEQEEITPARLTDRFFASIDAIVDPRTGQAICRSDLQPNSIPQVSDFPGNPFPGYVTFRPGDGTCKPLNLFGLGAPSAEAQAFNTYYETSQATIDQFVFAGLLRGDSEELFSLPGGPIGWAAGLEYRIEESSFTPDAFRQAGYIFDGATTLPESGKFNVFEYFGEVSLPLLADVPFFNELTIGGAFRGSDYSTIGKTESWKADLVWAPIEDIRFRGGIAKTVRAPNITEIFGPEQSATFRPIDPCDAANINRGPQPQNRLANCRADGIPANYVDPLTARFLGVTGGNPDLQEETADTVTIGVVVRPRFLPGFSLSVDRWDITIEDAIASVTAQDIVDACYDAPTLGNAFCGLFTRNRNPASPTFLGFNFLRQSLVNFASFEASGYDFDVNYGFSLAAVGLENAGDVRLRVAGTYNDKNDTFQSATSPNARNPELGELDYPELSLNTTLGWDIGKFGFSLNSSYVSEQTLRGVEIESINDFVPAEAPATWIHNLSMRYDFRDNITFVFGVNNLADEIPFLTETNIPVSGVGRSFFARVGATF